MPNTPDPLKPLSSNWGQTPSSNWGQTPFPKLESDPNTPKLESDPNTLPIACELEPAALAARQEGELAALRRSALQLVAIPDGIRLVLPGNRDSFMKLSSVIAAERECCRFLRFRLEMTPGMGELTLEVDGPPGTGDFLAEIGLGVPTPNVG